MLLRPVLLEHNEQGRAWEEMKSESDPRARILSVTRDMYRETTQSDLRFRRMSLAAVWRMDTGTERKKERVRRLLL